MAVDEHDRLPGTGGDSAYTNGWPAVAINLGRQAELLELRRHPIGGTRVSAFCRESALTLAIRSKSARSSLECVAMAFDVSA